MRFGSIKTAWRPVGAAESETSILWRPHQRSTPRCVHQFNLFTPFALHRIDKYLGSSPRKTHVVRSASFRLVVRCKTCGVGVLRPSRGPEVPDLESDKTRIRRKPSSGQGHERNAKNIASSTVCAKISTAPTCVFEEEPLKTSGSACLTTEHSIHFTNRFPRFINCSSKRTVLTSRARTCTSHGI